MKPICYYLNGVHALCSMPWNNWGWVSRKETKPCLEKACSKRIKLESYLSLRNTYVCIPLILSLDLDLDLNLDLDLDLRN